MKPSQSNGCYSELVISTQAGIQFSRNSFFEQDGILSTSVQSRKVLPTAASVRGTCREAIIDTLLT